MDKITALEVKLIGRRPLLMHNGRLANPLDPYAKALKALTAKKGKTDDDYEACARAEFFGGIYCDDKGPYIPTDNFESCMREAAVMIKRRKDVERASLQAIEDVIRLVYDGPRDTERLWELPEFIDTRGVGVNGKTIQRTRPIFRKWETEPFHLVWEIDVFDPETMVQIIDRAGRLVGLGDHPKYGRFVAQTKVIQTALDALDRKEAA